jgi:ribosomal protein L15E
MQSVASDQVLNHYATATDGGYVWWSVRLVDHQSNKMETTVRKKDSLDMGETVHKIHETMNFDACSPAVKRGAV